VPWLEGRAPDAGSNPYRAVGVRRIRRPHPPTLRRRLVVGPE
jgi:hypothetical protein